MEKLPGIAFAQQKLLLFLFFLSGFSALLYEVLWMRKLVLVFGNTTAAVSTILAVFFAGLGAGSIFMGKYIQRQGRPRLYGWLEIGIGVFGLATVLLFLFIEKLAALLLGGGSPLNLSGLTFGKFFLSFLVLFVPTFFMGGTFPAAVQYLEADRARIGRGMSMLYAVNTLGACLGGLAAAFLLLPVVGVHNAIMLAAIINFTVGIIALRRLAPPPCIPPRQRVAAKRPAPVFPRGVALLLLFLTGFAAIGLEVVWTRLLILIIGISTYAFALVLVVFLLGIGVGSIVVARQADEARIAGRITWGFLLLGALLVLTVSVADDFPLMFAPFLEAAGASFPRLTVNTVAFLLVVLFPQTFLMGMLFPLLLRSLIPKTELGAPGAGLGYGVNALGSIAGPIAVGFFFIPRVGLEQMLRNFGLGYLVLALFAAYAAGIRRRWGFGILIAVLVVASFAVPRWNAERLLSGVFIYRRDYIDKPAATQLLFWREGRESTVAVRRDADTGNLSLVIDGKIIASSHADLATELLLGHVPMLLATNPPREALVIGLGSGITAGALLRYPELERLDVVELEPVVREVAATFFEPYNNKALSDPRTQLTIGDGRNFLLFTNHQYDVVSAEPSNPWIAGMANLFTKDYYELVRQHLKPGGVMFQWLHYYNMPPEDLAMIVKTFTVVFPYTTVWVNPNSSDLFLLGSVSPYRFSETQIAQRLQTPEVAADLQRIFIHQPADIFRYFLAGAAALQPFTARARIHSDAHPYLEFSTPKSLYIRTRDTNAGLLARFATSPLAMFSPPASHAFTERIRANLEVRDALLLKQAAKK